MSPKRRATQSSLFSGSLTELLHPPSSQIPFLDGLRTLAVLLVINGHLSAEFAKSHGANLYSRLPFVANGWIGVDLFFVLSGFFIGGQLWKELRDRGTISIGRFVLRRGFRIWPLYFFTFLCILAAMGTTASGKEYGWSDLAFITNYHNRGIVMGSWSLCTEEQFYIITPLALFFLARYLRHVESWRPWLWATFVSIPLLRIVIWTQETGHFFEHNPKVFAPLYYNFHTHCDGLLMGLLISNLWVTRQRPTSKFLGPGVLVATAVVLLVGLRQLQHEIFGFTGLALLFGSLVWLGLQRRPHFFDSPLFYWISRLSFGMYLNHEYMCPWVVHTIVPKLPFVKSYPIAGNLIGVLILVTLSALIALITFCLVEHPFLQLRRKVLEAAHPISAS